MKLIVDIMELYENISDIPKRESGAWFNEKAIIERALQIIGNEYFPSHDASMLVANGRVKYLTFSNEYPSRIPDKVVFSVIPA